jgi:hypothetical protein
MSASPRSTVFLSSLLLVTPETQAWAQTVAPVAATINISTAVTTLVAPNFSGVSADLDVPVEYWDYRFNALAAPDIRYLFIDSHV